MTTNMHMDLGKTSKTAPYGRSYQHHRKEEGRENARKKASKNGRSYINMEKIVHFTSLPYIIIIIDHPVSGDD